MAEQLTPGMKDYERWKIEIDAAEKRIKNFYIDGGKIVQRFLDDRGGSQGMETNLTGDNPFRLNIFHANVTTMLAMLYGRVPETDVSRRWADPNDDVARVAAEILQRMLNISVQAPGSSDTDLLRACLQDRLLPGLGVARVRYDFTKETRQARTVETNAETGLDEIVMVDEEVVADEEAPLEYVHWRDFLWGDGRIWANVPWVAFRIALTKPEVIARFGEEAAEKLQFTKKPAGHKAEDEGEMAKDDTWMKTEIIEIWEKSTRKVVWWSKDTESLLDTREDPLKLRGFFPCPEPFVANTTTTMYLPRADFKLAQDLYNQIDTLQTRIGIITKAVKVVGVYNQKSNEIKRMLNEGVENDLIPVDNWAMFGENGGLEQISWLPIKDVVEALGKLQELRNEHIQLLYQITGMADILRGTSEQYTAASSDKLKAKFASIRVQHIQDEFARFASDLMSLRAEIIKTHFDPESIYAQSNAQFLAEEQEAVQQAIQFIKSPGDSWLWKVDIKPESIAMIDYAQLKAERTEYLTAAATFMSSAKAMGDAAPEAVPALLEMLKWGLAGFKGGQQMEGMLDRAIDAVVEKAKNPPPPVPNPKVQEIQLKHQTEMEKQAKKSNDEMMKMFNQHKIKLKEILAESGADAQAEAIQAYYNILEVESKFKADKELKRMDAAARRASGE